MKNLLLSTLVLLLNLSVAFGQSIDRPFSTKKMLRDLEVFKKINRDANSGLCKYRSQQQIDSCYAWAESAILKAATYRDFFNIMSQLVDFQGSLHNDISITDRQFKSITKEGNVYFPYPIKWIEGAWVINYDSGSIPLGAKLISINGTPMEEIIPNLYKYYTTDGANTTGKRIGIEYRFSKYFRFYYGKSEAFEVKYQVHNGSETQSKIVAGVNYQTMAQTIAKRYSKPFDEGNYRDWEDDEIYTYKKLDANTGMLTINDFSLGNEVSPNITNTWHF